MEDDRCRGFVKDACPALNKRGTGPLAGAPREWQGGAEEVY
jgi:hypothetical protein